MKSNVAIIMSIYIKDNLEYIKLAIDSLIEQTYKVDIYLYIDGPICDDVSQYVNLISRYDFISITRSSKNKGLAGALNSLIDLIDLNKYDFIARMDSDDISRKNRIEKQVEFLINNPDVDVCGAFCSEFGSTFSLEKKELPQEHNELLNFCITRCPFIHPTVMFRSAVFSYGNRYPINTALTEDLALWFNLLDNGYIFANVNDVLLDYRMTEYTLTKRLGLSKLMSEVYIRLYYMIKLRRISFYNVLLIFSRILFHVMPLRVVKFLYLNFR